MWRLFKTPLRGKWPNSASFRAKAFYCVFTTFLKLLSFALAHAPSFMMCLNDPGPPVPLHAMCYI